MPSQSTLSQSTASQSPRESGYALLMVFLLAALIGLSLYSVMPRVAFESQRGQEQMLIDRGGQYKRAIQLYFHKFRRYPAKMEDIENSYGQRFLRQRYNDPLTGKNEWRLIHVGPGGALTDSLTQKSNAPSKDSGSVNNFITELKAMGDDSASPDTQVPVGMRRRPSDPGGMGSADPNAPPVQISPTEVNNDAGEGFEVGGAMPPNGNGSLTPVVPNAQGYIPGGEMNPNAPGNAVFSGQPNLNASLTGPNGNPSLVPSYPVGSAPPTSPNDVIRNLLTSPRPGGPPPGIFNPTGRPMTDVGFADGPTGPPVPVPTSSTPVSSGFLGGSPFAGGQPTGGAFPAQAGSSLGQAAGGGGGSFVAGSFAGVASTVKRPSIKIYNDHQKYNEWEFIYDYGKEAAAAAGIPQNGNPANPLAPGQQANPQNGQNPQNPFTNASPPSAGTAPQNVPNQ